VTLVFVLVLCVGNELIFPKLKVLPSGKIMRCVVKLVLAWIWTLDMIWNWVLFGFGLGFSVDLSFGFWIWFLDLKVHSK